MTTRRQFLGAAGTAAAGLAAFDVRAQPARKEIRIGGRRAKVVDVHAHCVFPEVSQRVPGAGRRASHRRRSCSGRSGSPSMDERGIDIQALSVNAYWWYSADRELARQIVATTTKASPRGARSIRTRFVFLSLGRAAVSRPRGRAARARREEPRRARRLDRRPRRQRAADVGEIRSVLGEGRGARRAGVHASEQRAQHRARRCARRPRRPRQHRRQSARDDGVS